MDAENGFAAYRDNMNPGEKQTVTGYFIRKYLQENNADFDDKGSDQFWIEMRYAEVLLNLAEALAEQDYSKNQDDALEALNEVRERVNLPKRTTEEAPDKDSFMKLLRKERICELAFEGFRYWDLRRWRLAGEVIDGKQAHGTKITKKDDNTYTYVDAENGFAAYRDNMNPGEKQTVTGYFIRKYLQENNTEFDDKGSDQFWIEMRYAEVLLNLAEALAEQDYAKNQDDALEALNEVRRRVDLPERTTQEAPDKDSFMKLLRKERICELAFEGFRYWDLRRWRLAGEVIDGKQAHGTKITKKDDNSYTYEQVSCDDNINRFFPERYYLLPIPVDELQNNPLCENNAPW